MSSANPSPSSSPAFGPIDSSPMSSPHLAPYSLDSPPLSSVPLSHPFAASVKAIKRLPNYEKKTTSPPRTPPGTFTSSTDLYRSAGCSRSLREDEYMSSGSPLHQGVRYIDDEERIWDDALRKPFDTGNGYIDLSYPASIGDLSGFFNTPELSEQTLFSGRSLARVNTEPAFESSRVRSFERTQSIKDSGKERHVLQLYLGSNMIKSLPPELFTVRNLTVLSLRGNKLTFIPPDICRLTNLSELNISFNQLTHLPWEMRDMRINKLLVHPNPFLPELSQTTPPLAITVPSLTTPKLSAVTTTLPQIPPLTELCLRLLLARSEGPSQQSTIAEYYVLPLSERWNIPPHVRTTLMECVPGILRPRKRFSMDTISLDDQCVPTHTGPSACPNPEHKGRRFSWERRVAGVDIGGAVPLRWRGCLRSCLDFLDAVEANSVNNEIPALNPAQSVEMDVEMELAVQGVDLGSRGLDLDDFDD
ncbi:hypothetical protein BU15DRAFT_89731 [Melanogaster broomeanus]|nr:hypothetical protein BU15DRAFT_89731 [Melanogaster broomeanus]